MQLDQALPVAASPQVCIKFTSANLKPWNLKRKRRPILTSNPLRQEDSFPLGMTHQMLQLRHPINIYNPSLMYCYGSNLSTILSTLDPFFLGAFRSLKWRAYCGSIKPQRLNPSTAKVRDVTGGTGTGSSSAADGYTEPWKYRRMRTGIRKRVPATVL